MRAFPKLTTAASILVLAAASGCGSSKPAPQPRAASAAATTAPTSPGRTPAGPSQKHAAPKLVAAKPAPKSEVARALAKAPAGPPPARAATPVPRSGDKSIQTYGHPAPESDFARVARTLTAFNHAVATHDVRDACALLASSVRSQILRLASHATKSPGERVSCAKALGGLLRRQPPAAAKQLRSVRVTDARIKGDSAFVIYTLRGEGRMAQAMRREAGHWAVASLGGVPLQ